MENICHIGTSGWSYEHWRGVFYPLKLPAKQRLPFYARTFATVEINNTFYQLPKEATVRDWSLSTPSHFTFAVKASRFITHVKRLKDAAGPLENFIRRARQLGEKLGIILFQLPPKWSLDSARFEQFISLLPSDMRYAFEFRDGSWFTKEVYRLMERRDLAFCLHDMAGVECPFVVTSSMVYIRFHGASARYAGRYGRDGLAPWADRIEALLKENRQVYVYFNNDALGYAIQDGLELKGLLGATG